jgi:hypothetical protein
MEPYALKKFGLLPLKNHSELFLFQSKNNVYEDLKTGDKNSAQLYPIASETSLDIHFIHPPVYSSIEEANLSKLKLLESEKSKGKNYWIKTTLEVVYNPKEISDFFSDRRFVLTDRKDISEFLLSTIFALKTRIFHARENNIDLYKDLISTGVMVDEKDLGRMDWVFNLLLEFKNLRKYISDRYDYINVFYEDTNTKEKLFNKINDIFCTDDWRSYYKPLDFHPIKIEKDYKEIIINYNEIRDYLVRKSEEYYNDP